MLGLTSIKDVFFLQLIAYNDEKHRNQGQIQEFYCILDETLCNYCYHLLQRAVSLSVAEFMVLCEYQSSSV